MLNRVIDVLARQGWFDTSLSFETSIHLTQGACLWMLLSRDGVPHTHVKFSDCFDLAAEAARSEAASRAYPGLAPAFIGHGRFDGIDVLVSRAADAYGFDPEGLLRKPPEGLIGYFAVQPRAQPPRGVVATGNAELAGAVGRYFAQHPLSALAGRWLASDAVAGAAAMPAMPQHGDLVLNNLGRRGDGSLVIFDWEDFGTVSLPGLDLYTLELSLAADAGPWLAGRGRRSGAAQALVGRACAAMGLAVADYERLAPFYALVFRYLKRNYGPEVRARMDREIRGLAETVSP